MIRGVGLRSAVAVNVATMIGAGPLITIPLVVAAQHGSPSILAWIAGAAIALCDGLVYAELASRLPRSGGTYAYLREAFGAHGPGRLLAFLFVWQVLFWAPLTLASGYIGFAQYAAYLVPAAASPLVAHAIAIAVGLTVLAALYRSIPQIARTAVMLGSIALITLIVIAAAGLTHATQHAIALLPRALSAHGVGLAAFGAALVITLYDYGGYNDVCALGDEVIAPTRTIPLAVVISIGFVAIAYIALNLGIFAALPLDQIAASTSVASLAVERTLGHNAAIVVTVAILVTAFASTYGLLLGTSRVPYAAAADGDFLPAFARLHASGRFPSVALLTIGLLALPATLFPLDAVINALTAGIVLIQGVGGNLALVVLRRRRASAPFRLPFYPLPVVIATGAWLFLFWASGGTAMVFGIATLVAGALIFLVRARTVRAWPFLVAAVALLAFVVPHPAGAAGFSHARIVRFDGTPALAVDGKPFFFFGAAFFYERIPPERWRASMLAMRALGANTLDVYIPWNWHEIADGAFDFDGHTNPRRNLRGVLRLARELGFHLIVRPGPVIRNEWRNGGYPAWLLERPDYGMPLHDVLEGRYPATATLQNAQSDDAAAQWLANPTHVRYASRWLKTSLREFIPYSDLVIAIALDDDQGAYIDNQTWPAPHLRQYLSWLDRQVRSVAGGTIPTFINTYDMKVPMSSPVWAMGNWYQSDAFRIGDHDRVELDFATSILTTQERVPLAVSEFQAGWLASPEDPQPRRAAGSNTTLALAELLAWGAHGVVDFPLQDTLAPFGWEAPFSNAFYAWDAALGFDSTAAADRERNRYRPTAEFGAHAARWGAELATTHRVADIAIAYETSSSDARATTNEDIGTIVARFKENLRSCNARGLTCDVVDLRLSSMARMRRYRTIVVAPFVREPLASVRARLRVLAASHVTMTARVPNRRGSGITVLASATRAFGIAANWSNAPMRFGGRVAIGTGTVRVPQFTVAPHDARFLVLRGGSSAAAPRSFAAASAPARSARTGALLNSTERTRVDLRATSAGIARVVIGHAFGTGDTTVSLIDDRVFAVVSPGGGARLVAFAPVDALRRATAASFTDATGALRDDVKLQPPPSMTDRIAKYTHSYPAGMFNRPYRTEVLASGGRRAIVRFTYDAPDVLPHGAHFVKTVRLDAGTYRLVIDEDVRFPGDTAGVQRAVSRAALAIASAQPVAFSPRESITSWSAGALIAVNWEPDAVENATWTPAGSNGTLALTASPGTHRTTYALVPARTPDEATRCEEAERTWLGANPK